MRYFRLAATWPDGQDFFLTLGDSINDCLGRVVASTDHLTPADLDSMAALRVEVWAGSCWRTCAPVRSDLRRMARLAAAERSFDLRLAASA